VGIDKPYVGTDKPYVETLAAVVNRDHEPVLVSTDIEHDPVIGQYVRATEHLFGVGEPL
jgi:hypothetical protein